MPGPKEWGPPTWTFFHSMAEQIIEERFSTVKKPLFGLIKNICAFLPCPECSKHATLFFHRVNLDKIQRKSDFRNLFYIFHNMVNKRLKRPMFPVQALKQYTSTNVFHALNRFLAVFHTRGNMSLLSESFHRSLVIKNVYAFFKMYGRQLFRLPQSLSQQTLAKIEPAPPVPIPDPDPEMEEKEDVLEKEETEENEDMQKEEENIQS
jgi:hypothetical protein